MEIIQLPFGNDKTLALVMSEDEFDNLLPASEILHGRLLEVIGKLPHSSGRMPYTYHHDYLIRRSAAHSGMSRSDVAASHSSNTTELYAVALVQLLDELGSDVFLRISDSDAYVCRRAKELADAVLARHNVKQCDSKQ